MGATLLTAGIDELQEVGDLLRLSYFQRNSICLFSLERVSQYSLLKYESLHTVRPFVNALSNQTHRLRRISLWTFHVTPLDTISASENLPDSRRLQTVLVVTLIKKYQMQMEVFRYLLKIVLGHLVKLHGDRVRLFCCARIRRRYCACAVRIGSE